MTDNFEKKVAVDGPVVNAGELGSSTFSPGQALPAGPLGLGQRWTVARKREVVLRLLRDEPVQLLSRQLGVEIFRLEQWREKAIGGIDASLKQRKGDPVQAELDSAMKRIGELTMQVELLEAKTEIGVIERRIKLWHRSNAASRKIAEIPGVGVLSATAVVAAMGDPAAFRSGREFAAWLGLVPRHSGTGGRVRMLGISKRGDRYLRTLLIHGARAVLTRSKTPPEWALRLAERRPANVVTVAIANKTARTIWALLAHDRAYQPNFVSQPA